MRRFALLLCSAAFVASCKGKLDQAQPRATVQDSAGHATSSNETTTASEPVVENFDRIPTSGIDSALDAYESGDTLSKDSIDNNECLEAPIYRIRLKNNLTVVGVDNPRESDWTFDGKFHPILGLESGMTQALVRSRLGRPRSLSPDSMMYFSAKPTDYDSANFDARWEIHLGFHGDSLRTILFEPFIDDC